MAIVVLVMGVLALPGAAPAGAAAATVPNGLTTTALSAVGMSPAGLAADLVGPGVTVSNVTYSGANAQAGMIHVVDPAVVSFNDGIIMSSGNIADVVGPNKSDGTTGDMAGPADADLTALISGTQTVNPMTYDAASLEFDFVPTANQVYFTYTFASDEYLEWVNLFNDVFAFYVNGQNCATVPGGNAVSIDTINSAVNPNLFRDNSFSSPPANPINFESDGLSVEMICSAPVLAGQTNHMKLAIADTSDQILDSVVMIKAQSLSTIKPESCNDSVDNDDDLLVDDADPSCQATTTPPPPGGSGIGSGGNAPPFTGNEGTPIPLDASALNWEASAETLSTSWTVTGINGTPGTCEVSPAGRTPLELDGSIAVAYAVCPNEGEYVARVDGWDIDNKSSFDKDVDFFVQNAPPAVAIDTPTVGAEVPVGGSVSVSATVTDPGPNDAVTCEIDWGDGVAEPGTVTDGVCDGTHEYAAPGTPIVAVTSTDDGGASAAAKTVLSIVAPPSTGTISGTLTDLVSTGPAAGVDVRAYPVGSSSTVASTTTAPDGTYSLTLDPGSYNVQFAKSGTYLTSWALDATDRSQAATFTVVGGDAFDASQAMTPTRTITGTVTSSTGGLPVAGAGVWAYRNGVYSGRHTTTDANGAYTLGGLPTGTWQIRVTRLGFLDQWFSGSPDLAGSLPISVTTTNAPVANFALYPDPPSAATVAGTITDAGTGLPVAGADVRLWKEFTDSYISVKTDALGHYLFGSVPAAGYRLQVSKAGVYKTRWSTTATTRAAATPYALSISTNLVVDMAIQHI